MSRAPKTTGTRARAEVEVGGVGVSRPVKVEANFLRLPLFALHTRGLKALDGIECRGRTQRDGVVHDFTFSVSRNTATTYPGPLARSAHLALLSLITDRGFPLENPVTWTWRDLCRRMKITYSGRAVGQIKEAILATKGLLIRSQDALYCKGEGTLLRTRERALGLYDDVVFASDRMPDGGRAEANALWLARWYLDNLNAFFSAPIDHELWRSLDAGSTIASRLYELLLLNFHGGTPVYRINYKNLAQFLPVRAERYASDARRQLDGAFRLLLREGVLEEATWGQGRDGSAQLVFRRGPRLSGARGSTSDSGSGPETAPAFPLPDASDLVETTSTPDPHHPPESVDPRPTSEARPAEWSLVADFYRAWSGVEGRRPTAKELGRARELVERHGTDKARTLVELAIKKMKVAWPAARSFGALDRFLDEAVEDFEREARRREAERQERARKQEEDRERRHREDAWSRFEATWRPVWLALPEARRDEMRRAVLAHRPFFARTPKVVEALCLEQLAQHHGVEIPR